MQNYELGMNIDQVLVLNTPDVVTDSTFSQRFEFFRNQLENQTAIRYVASTTSIPGKVDNLVNSGLRKKGEEEEMGINYYHMLVDHQFIPALDFKFLAGENFHEESKASQQGLILNQAAVEKLGFFNAEDAIGEIINSFSWRGERPIIGVVENFHQESLKNQDYPIVMLYDDFAGNAGNFYTIKIQGGQVNLSETIALIEASWNEAFPNNPFDYFFLDTYYNNLYKAEFRFRQVFGLFTALAIFIACLGLLALSSYTTLQRTKEIGIRKVLGASVTSILILLSRDYIKLILIAFAIAIPVANYFMHEWLEAFAYRIEIQWWLFTLPGIMVLLIALLSVSSQSWRAARRNPVDSLRYE
jgi:putative ABC transport system permease protein